MRHNINIKVVPTATQAKRSDYKTTSAEKRTSGNLISWLEKKIIIKQRKEYREVKKITV
jgi:hypothetical protein